MATLTVTPTDEGWKHLATIKKISGLTNTSEIVRLALKRMVEEMAGDEQYSEELRRLAAQSLKSAENKELLNVGKRIIHTTLCYPAKVRKWIDQVLNDTSLNAKEKHNILKIIGHIADAYVTETKETENAILKKIRKQEERKIEGNNKAERLRELLIRHGRLPTK
jgi:sulfur relay (sulfurtransferase) DsrC/TusE family protein